MTLDREREWEIIPLSTEAISMIGKSPHIDQIEVRSDLPVNALDIPRPNLEKLPIPVSSTLTLDARVSNAQIDRLETVNLSKPEWAEFSITGAPLTGYSDSDLEGPINSIDVPEINNEKDPGLMGQPNSLNVAEVNNIGSVELPVADISQLIAAFQR
jgi:hypothetical protein